MGANRDNNITELIRYFSKKGRIHFVHVRNIKFHKSINFEETSHKTEDDSLDMYEIMKAYYDIDKIKAKVERQFECLTAWWGDILKIRF